MRKVVPIQRLCFFLLVGVTILKTIAVASAQDVFEFPQDFKWCTATAAFQVEGGIRHSDWSEWEQQEGKPRSGLSCDHWNRVGEDIALMQGIHANAYRFSIEWSRIEPSEGVYDPGAIAHYRAEVESLVASGITPLITLQHFTLPIWVKNKGGWEWSGLPEAFTRFVELVYRQIAPQVDLWITMNEPMNYILGSFFTGEFPPGEKRELQGIVGPLRGLLKAHALAYHKLHELADQGDRKILVGMALHLREMVPLNSWNILDRMVAGSAKQTFNWTIPDALNSGRFYMNILRRLSVDEVIPGLAGTQDFMGVNYYAGDSVRFSMKKGLEPIHWDYKNPADRPLIARGFYSILKEVTKRYPGKPLYVTENGTTFESQDPELQPKHLSDHIQQLAQAMAEGVPVKSYCYWSLLDNFEWNCGTECRFGLYETNFSTFQRTPRKAAELFRAVASENRVEKLKP
ncbi:MAG: glycoside hydrolase family 1 protein [Bdellovibrionia bacterium]